MALDYYDSSILEEIHANIAIIEKHLKEQQRDQAAHKVESPRRNRDQLKYIPIRFLLSSSSRVKSKSNDSSQHQSKSKNIERCCQNRICLTEVKKDKNLTFWKNDSEISLYDLIKMCNSYHINWDSFLLFAWMLWRILLSRSSIQVLFTNIFWLPRLHLQKKIRLLACICTMILFQNKQMFSSQA